MGRKKQGTRKPKPEWQKQVDADMRIYLTWGRTIEHQTNILLTLELSGVRVTPVYELREGKGSGPVMHQTEKIAITRDFAERKIVAGQKYRATIEAIAREAARSLSKGDSETQKEYETFIKLYWLTADTRVSIRARYVIEALPALKTKNKKGNWIPNRTFYRWRDSIYERLGELMGYLPEDNLPKRAER